MQRLREYCLAHTSTPDAELIVRSRREIIQHCKAVEFLFKEFIILSKSLTEKMILDTHRILTENLDILKSDGTLNLRSSEYAGSYWTIPVRAGNTCFVSTSFVPKAMKRMVEDFRQELTRLEEEKAMDPFCLAARLSNEFVQIHPFADGNGRMSRFLLNAITMKYAGVCVDIGNGPGERDEYIGIMKRASAECQGAGELSGLNFSKGVERLRRMARTLGSLRSRSRSRARKEGKGAEVEKGG